jgi:hypothetical protein
VTRIRLKIDIGGTVGIAAWEGLKQFPEAAGGAFGPDEGSGGVCEHAPEQQHRAGEWWGAVVEVENHLLAEYALAHYLEQPRVTDAYLDER